MKESYSKFTVVLGAVWVVISVTSVIDGNYWEATLSLLLAIGVLVNGYLSWEARKLKRDIKKQIDRVKVFKNESKALEARERMLILQLEVTRDRVDALRRERMNRENDR